VRRARASRRKEVEVEEARGAGLFDLRVLAALVFLRARSRRFSRASFENLCRTATDLLSRASFARFYLTLF
jgi:hypothetical protein